MDDLFIVSRRDTVAIAITSAPHDGAHPACSCAPTAVHGSLAAATRADGGLEPGGGHSILRLRCGESGIHELVDESATGEA
jgi:hypothetical protein